MDFDCCGCEETLGITVICQSERRSLAYNAVAAAEVPCPHCGQQNQVCFHPTGEVVAVRPAWVSRLAAASLN